MKKWMTQWELYKLLKIQIFYQRGSIKQLKIGFLNILVGTLGASLLGNLLAGKGSVTAGFANQKERGIVRAGTGKQCHSSFNIFWNTKVLSKWSKI